MDPVTIGLIMSGLQLGVGALQMGDAQKLSENNVRPTLDATTDYETLVQMFQQQAMFGMDPNAMTFANEKNQNALAGSINAILQAGGDPNAINAIYGQFTDATEKLSVADSERRWQKIKTLADATDSLAKAKLDEFLYNQDAPYKDTAQLAAEKQKAGQQQAMAGFDFLGSMFVNQAAGDEYNINQSQTTRTRRRRQISQPLSASGE